MRKLIIWIIVWITVLASVSAFADLEVHFIDVGQGDATLIVCDGESMLIDGGPVSASEKVYSYVRSQVNHLDCIILTHPHSDHIGGVPAVLNAVPADLLLTPVQTWNSASFDSVTRYANAQGTQIVVPEEGDTIRIGAADVVIVHCWPDAWAENDMSIVTRLAYKDVSVLLTGDAEEMSEYMMLDSGMELKSDVLKVAHHGSRYSTTGAFLKAVRPKFAVISCGSDNDYGHPHEEVLKKLKGIKLYRTDLQGDIVMKSDGKEITFTTSRNAEDDRLFTAPAFVSKSLSPDALSEPRTYVVNRKTMKIHLPECNSVKEMSSRNRIIYTGALESLIELGYTPCRVCLK